MSSSNGSENGHLSDMRGRVDTLSEDRVATFSELAASMGEAVRQVDLVPGMELTGMVHDQHGFLGFRIGVQSDGRPYLSLDSGQHVVIIEKNAEKTASLNPRLGNHDAGRIADELRRKYPAPSD